MLCLGGGTGGGDGTWPPHKPSLEEEHGPFPGVPPTSPAGGVPGRGACLRPPFRLFLGLLCNRQHRRQMEEGLLEMSPVAAASQPGVSFCPFCLPSTKGQRRLLLPPSPAKSWPFWRGAQSHGVSVPLGLPGLPELRMNLTGSFSDSCLCSLRAYTRACVPILSSLMNSEQGFEERVEVPTLGPEFPASWSSSFPTPLSSPSNFQAEFQGLHLHRLEQAPRSFFSELILGIRPQWAGHVRRSRF